MSHTYIPTNWINKKTQLNADNMNKIEEELVRLARESGGLTEVLEGPGVSVTKKSDSSVIVGLKNGSSEDNLLVLDKDNGLILTLSMGYDPETRQLVLSSGSGWRETVQFDIDKSVVDGNYDPETRNLILTLSDDSDIVIDMSKLKINWEFIESDTINIIEGSTDQGIQTFRIECKISDKERNSITVVDDGLYSERLDWDGIGVSDESDGTWEFEGVLGFKNWFFESSKTVSIDEYTLEGKYGSLDYYNFGFIISPEEGNRLELKDGKLYSSDKLIEEVMLKQELDRLNDEYTALKNCKFPSSNSINMTKGEGSDGKLYIKSDIKLSQYLGNELYMTETGIMMAPYTPGPGKPDLTPYVNRLEELEREYPKKDIDLNYLKNSINI
jgi:hypothetical protein